MKNRVLVLLMLWSPLLTFHAEAKIGGHGGSGGDGYLCKKDANDLEYPPYHLRLIDTYGDTTLDAIVQNNVGQLMNPFGMRTIARFLNRKMPHAVYPHPFKDNVKIPFGTMILLRHLQIYFYHWDLDENLPDISDDGIRWWQVPRGCKKVQLAIQDLKTSTVRMSFYTQNLPVIDDLFLRLHETLISIRNQPGLNTTPVRRDVERLALIVRDQRDDFVRGLTEDYYTSMTIGFTEKVPPLVIPAELRCRLTWRMPPLDSYQPTFALASEFVLTRQSGSGRAEEKNSYRLQTAPGTFSESQSTEMFLQPTIYSSTSASEIHAFRTHFQTPGGVTYSLALYDHLDGAGVYVGYVEASFTDKSIAEKSAQKSTREKYNSAGLICFPKPSGLLK
ncbi:MAG: hypothetical protein AB7F86_15665 [Bdellovibrionales bacterium]